MAYHQLTDGTPLYYIDQGAGRPLVLLSALMFSADYFWQKNLPELADHVRVIAPDLRGHGLSGKPNHGYTIRQLAEDLHELLEYLDLKDAVLLGYSLGGFVALRYLADYPAARTGHLVLMEMTPRLPSVQGWEHPTFGDFPQEAAEAYGAALRNDRSIYNDFFQAAFLEPPPGNVLLEMTAQTWLTPTDVAADLIDEMVKQDWRSEITGITVSTTLFYCYPNNRILPTPVGQWMAERIPEASLVLFDGSSHVPFWEEPEKFNQALLAAVGAGITS
ncbi:MAG: alpha/beta hydrolase [Gammaproteobacteria bacterium]|nr:alpha/beta hydrolase [Gammaproteobacteria bacterium]